MIRVNKKMRDELKGIVLEGRKLPTQLSDLLRHGFLERDGCFFLKSLAEKETNATESNFLDKTGYECFINSIHIDDYTPSDHLANSFIFVIIAFKKWSELNTGMLLQAIISSDEFGATIKFHLLRDEESWIGDNLDKYEDPVIAWDSSSRINLQEDSASFEAK